MIYKNWQSKSLEEVILDAFKVALLCIMISIPYLILSPQVESIKEAPKSHMKDSNIRYANNKRIKDELKKLRVDTKADRAFILEFHDGTDNFTKCPFVYLDMTYESIDDSVIDYVDTEIKNIPVNRFSFIDEHIYEKEWIGDVKTITEEDRRLGRLLTLYDTKFIIFQIISTDNIPVAVLGVSYRHELTGSNYEALTRTRQSARVINRFFNEHKK